MTGESGDEAGCKTRGEPAPGRPVARQERLSLAIAAHKDGRLAEAESHYRRLLEEQPEDADALHFLGMLRFQLEDVDAGIELVLRSLRSDAGNGHAWNNLGNMYRHLRRTEQAAEAYRRAVGRDDGAAAPAWYNLALLHVHGRDFEEGLRCLREATRASRGYVLALQALAQMYYRVGRIAEAHDVYRQWAEEAPDNPIPRHLLAATSGGAAPERAEDRYIVRTFDNFAEHFDQKLARLQYRGPQVLAARLMDHPLYQSGRAAILDAGCGTGLCGPLLRSTAARLVGVDLSPGMLEKAGEREVYDELVAAELTGYIRACPGEFDIIVAADVLCYFGRLEEVAHAAFDAMRPEGMLCFSVEALPQDGTGEFRLHAHGRYAHGRDYVARVLASAGFEPVTIEEAVLRQELGEPVRAYCVSAWRELRAPGGRA